jgi:hypothetical protein
LVFNLFGLFLGLGLAATLIVANPILGVLLSMVGIISGLVSYRILSKHEAALTLSAIPAIAWIDAMALDILIGGYTFFNIGLVMVIVGLILSVVLWMMQALTKESEGGIA